MQGFVVIIGVISVWRSVGELEALTHCEPVERVHVSVPSAAGAAWIDLPQSPRQLGLYILCSYTVLYWKYWLH